MPFPVDVQYVNAAEQKLGVKFPADYVIRITKENGGAFAAGGDVWYLHPIFDNSDRKRLKRTCNDVVRETAQARQWPDFPEEAVAIGDNGTGDRLVLVPDSTGRLGNQVYWWAHDTGELHEVAESFAETH